MPEVRCIDCTHSSVTRLAVGRCARRTRPGWFPSLTHKRACSLFTPAAADAVALRKAQLATLGSTSA